MSSTLPGGATRAASADPSSLPQRQGMRLHQIVDVSSAPTQEGDSLVFKEDSGMWEPIHLPTGPGEVTEEMLADGSVTTYKIGESQVTLSRMADNSVDTAELNDNAVTDPKIGTRTPAQNADLSSGTGMLTEVLSKLATMVKNITGKASWLTPPAITLEDLNNHHTRHATGGPDAITPASINAATDTHIHPNATGTVNGFMSTADKSKLDTVASNAAPVSAAAPTALAVGQATFVGAAGAAARADHAHSIPGLATASTPGFMSAADKAKLDNTTALSNSTPDALTVGQAGAVGTATSAARADHAHSLPGLASGSAAGFMSSSDKTKLDSVASGAAGLTGSTPDSLTIAQTGAVGSSSSAARSDHAHQMPGYATTSAGGFMTAADKVKLDAAVKPKFFSVKPIDDYAIPASLTNMDLMEIQLPSNETGYWMVNVTVDLDWRETDDASVFYGRLTLTTDPANSAGDVFFPENILFMSTAVPVRITLSQTWIVHHSTATTRYLYFNVGKTAAGTTGSMVRRLHSVMHAHKIM